MYFCFVVGHDGQIKLIHSRQLVMFGVIDAHRCYISSLVFYNISCIFVVVGHDGQIKLIHPRQLVMFGVIEAHRCYISSLVFYNS